MCKVIILNNMSHLHQETSNLLTSMKFSMNIMQLDITEYHAAGYLAILVYFTIL
jgi:hypothetical protein